MRSAELITETQLADTELQLPLRRVQELRRRHGWPHVRLGRFDVRYTADQVRQIVELHTAASKPAPVAARVSVPGQSKRSASRRRSA